MSHYDIDITIVHVTGVTNCTADHLSRYHMSLFFSLNPQADTAPTTLSPALKDIVASPNLARLDFSKLQATIQHYYSQGLAPSTHKCYRTGQLHYITFCNQSKRTPNPIKEMTLLLFIAYLAEGGLAYTFIKLYLSAICSMHVTCGHHLVISQHLTPYLEQVMHGIKKKQLKSGTNHERLPITADLMQQIYSVLSHNIHDYNSVLMWAACCTAFFGLLRCNEFTVPLTNDYDPTVHLSLQDIAIESHRAPTVIRLNIIQSKMDPFLKGIQLFLGKTDHCVCPFTAILSYLALRGSKLGPLFIFYNSSPLTRHYFSTSLSAILSTAGVD